MNKQNKCGPTVETKSSPPEQIDAHSLMPFKVREILLVSSLYDAFIIEEEGLISEMVIGEYGRLHLSSPPRVTRVSSGVKALTNVKKSSYDLVITMSKNIGMDPFEFGKKIKAICADLPVILLSTETSDLFVSKKSKHTHHIDKAFFWNGDSRLFLAIIKNVEDKINAQFDTINGNVQVLIVLEDSVRDYSAFLPIMYQEIVRQTERSISEDLNEMQRLVRRRGRPKILLAETYDEALSIYKKYKENLLGIISDVRIKQYGKEDPFAGFSFIKQVRKEKGHVPILVLSSEEANQRKAEALEASFLSKHSPTLLKDFQDFLLDHLGFGDFVFLLPKNPQTVLTGQNTIDQISLDDTKEVARASNMMEFEQQLQKVPIESIIFHANRYDFSKWLMARGEAKLAIKIRPQHVSDFDKPEDLRDHLLTSFTETRRKKQLGAITEFSQQKFDFTASFTRIGTDSLGGKGRGIAFLRALLARHNVEKKYQNITVTVPSTVVIATDEFDRFITENQLHELYKKTNLSDADIAQIFLKASLSDELKEQLNKLLDHFTRPIAVRSSGLLEDSLNNPFAGLYSTYMLPNNHENKRMRRQQLYQAIKLVYASVLYKDARSYIKSISSKVEEEKMAVIIQEVVGREYNERYYPHFSGVAQSYNYYPISRQEPEDGIVSIALGLGKTVVGGDQVFRFCPKYPEINPDFSTAEGIFENSQRHLYVLNTAEKEFSLSENDDITLKKLDVEEVKSDGTLTYLSSSYDQNDGVIRDGFLQDGAHLITFASILKYELFPLASLLSDLLKIGQDAMGCPVEIEFAGQINNSSQPHAALSILQIRPLLVSDTTCSINWKEKIDHEKILLSSKEVLGNGVFDNITNIVYVDPQSFNSSKTVEIAEEVEKINTLLEQNNSSYLLIGPGRWGTQDPWLGIPVQWHQISKVKILVETAMPNFNIKPSQGTHFFHNIISKEIGYINIPLNQKGSFIDWSWLEQIKPTQKMNYIRYLKLKKPLRAMLDGRCKQAMILKS